MSTNGIAKIQHYVPQFLLKNFVSNEKNQIWIYDKGSGKKFQSNVKNVASEKGFYNFSFNENEVTFEPSISKIEDEASKIINKIIENENLSFLTIKNKQFLSEFFALQFIRTRQWRETWKNINEELFKKFKEPGRDDGIYLTDDEETKLMHMRSIHKAHKMASHFCNKLWFLFKAIDSHPFWISDNPIAMQNSLDFGPYGNIGLAVKGIEIYFPISHKLSIGMWCPTLGDSFKKLYSKYKKLYKINPVLVNEVIKEPERIRNMMNGMKRGICVPSSAENVVNHNSLQVIYSTRFIYSSVNDFSLADEMIQSHPELRDCPKIQVD